MDNLKEILSLNIWPALSAIFSGIAVYAIILVRRQLRFEAWVKAQYIFTDKDFEDARETVYKLNGKKYYEWSDDQTKKALLVCRKMDELAYLKSYLTEKTILETWDNPFANLWKVFGDFIKHERSTDKANWEDKWNSFEEIGKKAVERIEKSKRKKR